MSSKDTIRAYRNFEKQKLKYEGRATAKKSASVGNGLLARTMPQKKSVDSTGDQMITIYNIVDNIRKYGGKQNG